MTANVAPARLSLAWSSMAVFLVAAAIAGGGIGAFVAAEWATVSSATVHVQFRGKATGAGRAEPSVAATVAPSRIFLPTVAPRDVDAALDTMALAPQERQQLRNELATQNVRLLWLTLWDWDTATESGDTISITAGDYQRLFTLSSHRTKIAIPEPRTGRIVFRGERTEDGIIAISFLTGNRPVALPYMRAGDTVELEIDTH